MNIQDKANLYADAQFIGKLRVEKQILLPVIASLESTLKVLKGIDQEFIQVNPELVEMIEVELKEAKLSVTVSDSMISDFGVITVPDRYPSDVRVLRESTWSRLRRFLRKEIDKGIPGRLLRWEKSLGIK